jgi:hypothetical protein
MDENHKLRELLAYQYAGFLLYHDDGELQDNRAYPFIDFLRDDPAVIQEKMIQRTINAKQEAK